MTGSGMKRIFYFSGHRMTVFHWNRKTLAGACSFEPNVEGYEKFRQYLESSEKISTSMLLDVIEEDFRKDVIPHVHGKDREAVISRLLDRHYRSSMQYTYSEIQGRQKHGRKDDEVLLSAITNHELVRSWIRIVEACEVPLSGILSLPLISKSVLPLIGARKGHVLLVSQQVNSNLRQTFFKDGKVVSSRQSVINQDAGNISKIGLHARPEIERTITFIRNQYQLGDTDVIDVHILGSDSQIDSLESTFISDHSNNYHVHRLHDIQHKLGIKGLPDRFADGLFSWIALNRSGIKSHYGRKEEFVRFYYTLASKALYACSVIVILVSLIMIESNISDGISYKESSSLLQERTNEFRRVYSEKYQAYEEMFSNARLMDAAVGMVDQIEKNSQVTPLDFMLALSKLISKPEIGRIYIDKIEWTSRQLDKNRTGNPAKDSDEDSLYLPTNVTSNSEVQHVAVVTGRIPVTYNNYRDTVNRINNIITTLSSGDRVENVSAINLPVEVRPDKKFASETRTISDRQRDMEKNESGQFSLKVVMKAPENV
jgi:hypothetical protein